MLNSLRTLISTKTRSSIVMVVFIILTLVLGIWRMQHAVEILPILVR